MRAKLGIVYICITIIIATFPVHNCDKKSLHIAIHLNSMLLGYNSDDGGITRDPIMMDG